MLFYVRKHALTIKIDIVEINLKSTVHLKKKLGKVGRRRQRNKIRKSLCYSLPRKVDCRGFCFLIMNRKKKG